MSSKQLIYNLSEVNLGMIDLVGGKNASLGEMISNMASRGINVPNGFAISSAAYDLYIEHNQLDSKIRALIGELEEDNLIQLRKVGTRIRQLILDGEFPHELKEVIDESYKKLSQSYDQEATDVAVRSSATAEDLPDASFAGQQESFLNVRGHHM